MFRINNVLKLDALALNAARHKTTVAGATQLNYQSDEYQYLQKSSTPMLHFQPSLLRLPIPKLDKTCERYLAAVRPILSNRPELKQTEDVVNAFAKSGQPLQEALIESDKANKHTSYISEPWFDMYLSDRSPLPINYTPLLTMNPDSRPEYNDQLIRTTNLLISSLRFRRSLSENLLRPEVYHMNARKTDTELYQTVTRLTPSMLATYVSFAFNAYPLDMSQYQGLFGATRIPELNKDRIYRNPNTRHIVCIKDGHFFAMDVLDAAGNIELPEIIQKRLKHIIEMKTAPSEHPIAALTTENRNSWAEVRKHLVEIGNDSALNAIDSAILCLTIDADNLNMDNATTKLKDLLGSDGLSRWFDKSLSLIVGKDGMASIQFEHSWGDGVAVLRYFNEIYSDTLKSPYVHPESQPSGNDKDINEVFRKIELNLDDKAKNSILTAKDKHSKLMSSLKLHFMIYDGFSKTQCKKYGLSPDSIMQLGFQLAYLKQNGKYVPTYESCSTAAFRHGRTETIRPCTMATKAFCDSITQRNRPSDQELRAMIDDCSKVHGQLTKEAAMGQGFDRHLYGLKQIAEVHKHPIPEIFMDPTYAMMNKNIMSSSTLSSDGLFAGAFGPVVQNGYGIGYSIQEHRLGAIVTNYTDSTNGTEFIECLRQSYDEIKNIVVKSGVPAKKK